MNELLWFVSRATGTVSIVLLTSVLVLGALSIAFLGVGLVPAVANPVLDKLLRLAKRGGLLDDVGKVLTHDNEGSHV